MLLLRVPSVFFSCPFASLILRHLEDKIVQLLRTINMTIQRQIDLFTVLLLQVRKLKPRELQILSNIIIMVSSVELILNLMRDYLSYYLFSLILPF